MSLGFAAKNRITCFVVAALDDHRPAAAKATALTRAPCAIERSKGPFPATAGGRGELIASHRVAADDPRTGPSGGTPWETPRGVAAHWRRAERPARAARSHRSLSVVIAVWSGAAYS